MSAEEWRARSDLSGKHEQERRSMANKALEVYQLPSREWQDFSARWREAEAEMKKRHAQEWQAFEAKYPRFKEQGE